jgi:putative transposase
MHQLGLACQVRRRRYTSYRGEVGTIAANLLNRDVTTTAPNQKWVTDVTEFRVGEQKVYLAAILDRQIIAYSVGLSPTVALTNTALRSALATLPDGQAPLVHSDQGVHYQHRSWRALLAAAGATPSMSRKGNCLDNAVMENFFGHLKEELFNHTTFPDVPTFIAAVHAYMSWYNRDRISLRLKGVSPMQYRAQALAA